MGDWRVCASAIHSNNIQVQVQQTLGKASRLRGEDTKRQDCPSAVSAYPQDCQVSSHSIPDPETTRNTDCIVRKHAKVATTSTYMPLEDDEIAAAKKEWENIELSDVEED